MVIADETLTTESWFRARSTDVAPVVVDVPHTGNSGHSGGAVDVADPGPVDVGVNKGSGEVACVLGPGAVNIGDNVGVTGFGLLDGDDDRDMAVAVPVDRSTTELRGQDNADRVTMTTFWWALVRPPGKAAYRGWARARAMSALEIRMESFLRTPAPVFGLARVGRTPSPPVA